MSVHDRLKVHVAAKTPTFERVAALHTTELPADLLEAGSRRLGFASLIYTFAYTVSFGTGRIMLAWSGTEIPFIEFADLVAAISIGLSIAVFLVARSDRIEPKLMLDLGLGYWVISALGIDFGFYGGMRFSGLPMMGISWVCVWLVAFPLLVPTSPKKVLIAAFATASMGPLSYLFWASTSLEPLSRVAPEAQAFVPGPVQIFVPYYLCAILAFVSSRIVYKLGTDVTKARELGSYRLLELIGRGGMGEVWLAKHRLLARPAAIKLIRPGILGASDSDPSAADLVLKRFHREAQAIAALRSPHTVDIYDFGATDDGHLYYAMELLDGLDLETLVQRFGPVPAARAVFLLEKACDSLDDAHHHDLVHRDIKPSNIFTCRMGRHLDYVKVLDFGLVKHRTEHQGDLTRLTTDGITPGTPAYMAPELALSKDLVDGRADIYSLGCVAYWLLTGQPVFEGESPVDIIVKHVQEAPVPPSERTELEIPADLERVVLSCLAKDPEDRPGSALDLASALMACELKAPWTSEAAEEWWQLHMETGP
jgi:serine/threonine-protein kinase